MLFDQIWFWFIDMKRENDGLRDELALQHINKGTLRTTAPLLWFEWKRWDDQRGQTRNQENFDKAWKSFVRFDDGRGQKVSVAWLTVRSTMSPDTESPQLVSKPLPRFVTT